MVPPSFGPVRLTSPAGVPNSKRKHVAGISLLPYWAIRAAYVGDPDIPILSFAYVLSWGFKVVLRRVPLAITVIKNRFHLFSHVAIFAATRLLSGLQKCACKAAGKAAASLSLSWILGFGVSGLLSS